MGWGGQSRGREGRVGRAVWGEGGWGGMGDQSVRREGWDGGPVCEEGGAGWGTCL